MSRSAHVLPHRHCLTVRDFHRMGETGILPEDARIELIEGEIIDMAPIGSSHAGIVKRLNQLLGNAAAGKAIVSVQDPIILDDHSEPQPDVALLRPRDDFYALAHPKAQEVLLIIEVADSSLRFDQSIKIPLYARHGIPEVWLVDVEQRRLTRFLKPGENGYAEAETLEVLGRLTPTALHGIGVDLARLFG